MTGLNALRYNPTARNPENIKQFYMGLTGFGSGHDRGARIAYFHKSYITEVEKEQSTGKLNMLWRRGVEY
jgi:hypothetical protein